jgi:uncharacterized membrane protein
MVEPAQITRLERAIGVVLRVGVASSSICLGAGLALTLTRAGALANLLIRVGIIVLLGTPVARVLVSVAEYALERDWIFTLLTLVVLIELIIGALAAVR